MKYKIAVSLGIILIITGVFFQIEDNKQIKLTKEELTSLYMTNDILLPKEVISLEMVTNVEKKIKYINNQKKKKELHEQIKKLKEIIAFHTYLETLCTDNILNPTTTSEELQKMNEKYDNISKKHQDYFYTKVTQIQDQYDNILLAKGLVTTLFTDNTRKEVKSTISRAEFESVKTKVKELPSSQVEEELVVLNRIEQILSKKEQEERKKEEQKIASSWVLLKVPYISQNDHKVYNGCEAASLLMALKYKGYLKTMDLITYATNMPKNDDPNVGFCHSIFEIKPLSLPHWIAPKPLADYGRSSSSYVGVRDATGSSLAMLDQELDKNNPVIIYVTARFEEPKTYIGGVPVNLHVMLLTGYNKVTGEHMIIDPWRHDNGRTSWQVSKELLETRYNQVGKRAVVVG